MKTLVSLAIVTSLFCSPLFAAPAQTEEQGTLHVTVMDENGKVVPDAPVYIYGVNRTHFVGGADIPGSTTFTMKEGQYRISSALIKRTGEYIDRFASNEAKVKVVSGDNVSVILTLKPIEQAPENRPLSYATLHVAEVPGNLYRQTN